MNFSNFLHTRIKKLLHRQIFIRKIKNQGVITKTIYLYIFQTSGNPDIIFDQFIYNYL